VLGDHDRFYAPQYLASITSALRLKRHAPQLNPPGNAFVGDNGVYTVVGTQGMDEGHVITAFRVKPRGISPPLARHEDFITAAVNRLRDLTAFSTNAGQRTRT
jgi:hypothetical protein